MRRSYVGEVSVYRSNAYQGLRFADVQNCAPRAELRARARAYVGLERFWVDGVPVITGQWRSLEGPEFGDGGWNR